MGAVLSDDDSIVVSKTFTYVIYRHLHTVSRMEVQLKKELNLTSVTTFTLKDAHADC